MARARRLTVESTTLTCGLRIVTVQVPGVTECCGIAVKAGSRDERPGEEGLAHFVEHTLFKGTRRRRAYHIINRMETVGGELNAYTTKEETFFYTISPSGNHRRSIDLLSDLVNNSVFPARQLDMEREVVFDEIDSYLDSPMDAVFDDFEDIFFSGSQLGHNILGNRDTLRHFDTAACRSWIERYYRPEGMVMFYAGPAAPARIFRAAEDLFIPSDGNYTKPQRLKPPVNPSFTIDREMDTHQSHVLIGIRTEGIYAPDRFALALFNNIIGGPGMNSRLNVALRERNGLVYTVESSITAYRDSGLLSIYYGCDRSDLPDCKRLTMEELERLADTPLSESALNRARRQFLGQLIVGSSSIESKAMELGKCTLRGLPLLDDTSRRDIIMSITPAIIQDTARKVFTSPTLSQLTFL